MIKRKSLVIFAQKIDKMRGRLVASFVRASGRRGPSQHLHESASLFQTTLVSSRHLSFSPENRDRSHYLKKDSLGHSLRDDSLGELLAAADNKESFPAPDLYKKQYRRSLEDPESFWADAAKAVDWYTKWDHVLDKSQAPLYRWFSGAELNTCYNAVDRHVKRGLGERVAIIYDSPVTKHIEKITYKDLQERVSRLAGYLSSRGVEKGDRVVIYMPMVPEAAVAMLACARIGAIHSVVFGGFAPAELAARIDDAKPKAVISSSCGVEPKGVHPYKILLDTAISMSRHQPQFCLIHQRPMERGKMVDKRDVDFYDALSQGSAVDCLPVKATDPLYIIYTSGTTGQPKGIVRDHGGHCVALNWSMQNIMGLKSGETYWAASDIGWVVGHSFIVYGPLFHGCSSVLFEGKPVGTPDASTYWRVIEQHNVSAMFTAPTALRAIRREDSAGLLLAKHNISSLRTLFVAGERADPDTVRHYSNLLKVPIIDNWWQTETGWPICSPCVGLGNVLTKPGSAGPPVPGYDVRVLDEAGREAQRGQTGDLVIRLPLPPGTLPSLYQDDQRYISSYLSTHSGHYMTGDSGYIDDDGFVHVMSRVDDIINVAGHRISTSRIEEVMAAHPEVAECAAIGVKEEIKGHIPVGLVVLKNNSTLSHKEVSQQVVEKVRAEVGAVAALRHVVVVDQLPKTRSGKILRGVMRGIADSEPFTVPGTIENRAALSEVADAFRTIGYACSIDTVKEGQDNKQGGES